MFRNLLIVGAMATTLIGSSASVPLGEGVWIPDSELKNYPKIKLRKDFVVDHRKRAGFELYGPQGMKQWLSDNQIPYTAMVENKEENVASYPSFEQIEEKLKRLAELYPKRAKLIKVGESIRGKALYFLKISRDVSVDAVLPEFKYISSMHGDEITGRELMVSLAEDLLKNYEVDPQITELINHTEIYIMPSMNPDGSQMKQRWNANNRDLNRDFPDFTSDNNNSTQGRQQETIAIMDFQKKRNFALSANFHGGSEVVNYPWDTEEAPHPLDNLVQALSISYSKLVPYIYQSSEFPQGIVNGYAWYEVDGGMQDWSEHWYNDLQVTVELSGAKWPAYSQIPTYYQENRAALIQFIKNIHQGAGFYMKDQSEHGTVRIQRAGRDVGNYEFRNGEFYRVLEPGNYEFMVQSQKSEKSFSFSRNVSYDTVIAGGNYLQLN